MRAVRDRWCLGRWLRGYGVCMTSEPTSANAPGRSLPTAELRAEIAHEIRMSARDRDAAAAHNRRAAELIVTLRERFLTPTGDPDLLGEFREYRRAIRDVYSDAGIPAADRARVQSAIRYHVGNALRERYPAEVLEGLGLQRESPYVRTRERRHAAADELQESRLSHATNDELLATIRGLVETVDELRSELGELDSRARGRDAG